MNDTTKGSALVRGLSSFADMRTPEQRARPFRRPQIMGIVNVTPDSFSDGGVHDDAARAIAHARKLVEEGADILDIGGESTRPGSDAVSAEAEIARIIPVIEGCRDLGVQISVDTRKRAVMAAAVAAGAHLINDVSALEYDPESLAYVAGTDLPVCLMHSLADPKTMQNNPVYDDVLAEVTDYLAERVRICEAAGIGRDRIIIDPGIGFGKTVEHNLTLIRGLASLHSLGCRVLLGASRKRFIGTLTGEPVADRRISGSVAVALYGAMAGVDIVRVHDVRETREALDVWQAIESASF
ncbi:MAG: dihydropteroate synthase [Sneathiella sp.]|jgi:dihydropteroate synthase|uniref:dihydropteroate synthase n=1 Tax=Sneathiella sp. TaxID=1964365 RepID=UPI000C48F636|nr:dihydropteroate synthase [Sneathiella sp.]MAL78087.1 dihydropteroate synthase [Sneathiella sp.]